LQNINEKIKILKEKGIINVEIYRLIDPPTESVKNQYKIDEDNFKKLIRKSISNQENVEKPLK
jgi:hypothetical protein